MPLTVQVTLVAFLPRLSEMLQLPVAPVVQLVPVPVDQVPVTVAPLTGASWPSRTLIVTVAVQPPFRGVAPELRPPMLAVPEAGGGAPLGQKLAPQLTAASLAWPEIDG